MDALKDKRLDSLGKVSDLLKAEKAPNIYKAPKNESKTDFAKRISDLEAAKVQAKRWRMHRRKR